MRFERLCIGSGRILQANQAPCGDTETYVDSWNGAAWMVDITERHTPPNGCQ
jgi:hypothetical protein